MNNHLAIKKYTVKKTEEVVDQDTEDDKACIVIYYELNLNENNTQDVTKKSKFPQRKHIYLKIIQKGKLQI